MSLSVENGVQNALTDHALPPALEAFRQAESLVFHLRESRVEIETPPSDAPFNLDEWPILLFLQGLGFEKIILRNKSADALFSWVSRMAEYQQTFIQDPDNLFIDECIWNQADGNEIFVECLPAPKDILKRSEKNMGHPVPAQADYLQAPLGITPEMSARFVSEIDHISNAEIFARLHSILLEYEKDSRAKDETVWASFLTDVIAVALEAKLLDKAAQLSKDHSKILSSVWSRREKTLRLFSVYDPKSSQLSLWASIFDSLNLEEVVRLLESSLSTPAGPQILKLMNHWSQTKTGSVIDFCIHADAGTQERLLPWLAPHWKVSHFEKIWTATKLQLKNGRSKALTQAWLSALFRCSRSKAFENIRPLFMQKKYFWSKRPAPIETQKMILDILAEHPDAETLSLLTDIRKDACRELVHEIDRLHYSLKGARR